MHSQQNVKLPFTLHWSTLSNFSSNWITVRPTRMSGRSWTVTRSIFIGAESVWRGTYGGGGVDFARIPRVHRAFVCKP
jgi:hypothetical protein